MNNFQNPKQLLCFMVNETRSMDALAGDVAYTGYGFKPHVILVTGTYVGSITIRSHGSASRRLLAGRCVHIDYLSNSNLAASVVVFYTGLGEYQAASVKSFDADGFTLTWTKGAGGPAVLGHMNITALG